MVNKYIGVKIIHAEPMTAERAGKQLGRPIDTRNADAKGNGYLVHYEDGYTSWSPKKQFEEAYRKTDGMTFGLAVEVLKKGLRVARQGWNGKGMYLFLIGVSGSNDYWTYTNGKNDNYPLLPFISIKTPDDKVVPWVTSQMDVLAEDWTIVGDK